LIGPLLLPLFHRHVVYGPRRRPGLAPAVFFVLACLAWWPNTKAGLSYASDLRQRLHAFEGDVVVGLPIYELIRRHGPTLHPHQDIPTDYLPMLRRANVPPYQFLQDNPPLHEVLLSLPPTTLNLVTWKDGTAYGVGNASYLLFDLVENRSVIGVRMRYRSWNDKWPVTYVSVYWKGNDQQDFTSDRFHKYSPTGDGANWEHGTWTRLSEPERTMTVWIAEPVRQIRVHPDIRPGAIHISEFMWKNQRICFC